MNDIANDNFNGSVAVEPVTTRRQRLSGANRVAFDQTVFNAVRENGPINSLRLQRVVQSNSPAILRASLGRLEAEGLIKHSGNKRGTLYEAV